MKTKPCPTCGGTGKVPRYPTVKLARKVTTSWMDRVQKSPWPLGDEPFHWGERYFNVGDRIEWQVKIYGLQTKVKAGFVRAIKKNKFGRISYHSDEEVGSILIEDVARAEPREVPRPCVP